MTTAVVFDTETTGLIENRVLALDYQPHVIDVYAAEIDLADGRVLREFGSLVRPPIAIPEAIINYTRITPDMVRAAPRFAEVLPRLRAIIEAAAVVYAHNAHFDVEVLDVEVARLRADPIRWPTVMCTIEQTSYFRGHRMTLGDLHSFLFGEKFAEGHRAQVDATALARCVVELVRRELL